MEAQSVRESVRHTGKDVSCDFSNDGGHGTVRYSSCVGRGLKREFVDDHKQSPSIVKSESPGDALNASVAMATLQGDPKVRQKQCFSPDTDVGAWLRDEPVEVPASGVLLNSGSGTVVETDSSDFGVTQGKMETGSVSDGSDLSGYGVYLSDIAAGRRKGSIPTAQMFAQLKNTMIRESVMLQGIERLGGGEKGLRGVIKAIMFWLEAKNQHTLHGSDPGIPPAEPSSPHMEEMDHFAWPNLESGNTVDAQFRHFGSLNHWNVNQSLPSDLNFNMSSTLSCRDDDGNLCDLRIGNSAREGHVDLPNHQSRLPIFIGEPGAASGFLGGSRSHGASVTQKDALSGNWFTPSSYTNLQQEKTHCPRMVRKLSPPPDRSLVHSAHDSSVDNEGIFQQSNSPWYSHVPAGFSSSATNDFPAHFSTASPAVSEVLGMTSIFGPVGANPFAPGGAFSLSPSSPPPVDCHSLDFTSLGLQGSVLIDESLAFGSASHGCGMIDKLGSMRCTLSPKNSVDRKHSGTRLGVLAKAKASPAACTRLARKNRMDRNRKAAMVQVNRGPFETGALLTGKSGGIWPAGSLRNTCRSQGSPASEGSACKAKGRRDQQQLQYLLQKVLRPSDVGNLGRVVLPKKDAENHLPWLGAREGIQFACEDYDTGEKMTLRYRFWPNNKSRMYLLENTGDFVKKHHLQESDRMLIYRNQLQGTYIIRAGKARDSLEIFPSQPYSKDMEADGKQTSEQNSPGGPCSSGGSGTTESTVGSGFDGALDSCLSVSSIITTEDDLLNFADLPDAPMGEGTENLVRFPSLESFDVELLELAPVAANKQDTAFRASSLK